MPEVPEGAGPEAPGCRPGPWFWPGTGRNVIVPSSLTAAGPGTGRRKMNVPPGSGASSCAGGIDAVPSVRPAGAEGRSAGILGSVPQAGIRSCPGDRGCGSSSKKCGPVSSTDGAAGRAPGGGVSDSPSLGAGRLVPGTQEAPFQYRT